jgi:ribosomal protein S18 acetylase RimI-like enzyme
MSAQYNELKTLANAGQTTHFIPQIRGIILQIRRATEADAAIVLHYIKALALAEGFPFTVSVTIADLEENLLSSHSNAQAVLVYQDDKPCGFAVYYYSFSTTTGKRGLHLDDLYIDPDYQGQGVGRKVLAHLANLAISENCARFEWWALKTNDRAIDFYKKLGAKSLDETIILRVDATELGQFCQ